MHTALPLGRKKQGKQDRRFNVSARKTVVQTVCQHAKEKHALQQQNGVEQPDFPAVLVTGDWNLPQVQWRSFLRSNLPEHVAKKVQAVQSTMLGNAKHGDLTIAINCQAFQEETPDWTTFSDAHDVVITPVRLPGIQELPPSESAEQPPTKVPSNESRVAGCEVSPELSAEQPARQAVLASDHGERPDVEQPETKVPSNESWVAGCEVSPGRNAEQPPGQAVIASDHGGQPEAAPEAHVSVDLTIAHPQPDCMALVHIPADNLDIPSSTTPLYTQMVDNLASIDDEAADSEALADVERTFMFGSIMETPVPGRWCQHAPDRMVRLEWVLELLQERRNSHVHKLQERNDPRLSAAQPELVFSDRDMQEIMNDWKRVPEIWMRPDSLSVLEGLPGPRRHGFVKSRFGAMKFQLLGNQALVDFVIRFNFCGAVQPAALREFCNLWKKQTATGEHKKAQELSEKQAPEHIRRAKKIWILQRKIQRAQWIVDLVTWSWDNWYRLSTSDKNLYYSHSDNSLQNELKDILRTQAAPRNPGAASRIAAQFSQPKYIAAPRVEAKLSQPNISVLNSQSMQGTGS